MQRSVGPLAVLVSVKVAYVASLPFACLRIEKGQSIRVTKF